MTPAARRLRRGSVVIGGAVLAVVIAVAITGGLRGVDLPIRADLGGFPARDGKEVLLGRVRPAVATLIPALLVALALLTRAGASVAHRQSTAVERNLHTARWIVLAFVVPITVVLVGVLNGVLAPAALVLAYGCSAGAVLVRALQERVVVEHGPAELPLWIAAAVGIVPWGVIAFHQIGGGLAGIEPAPAVRILTLVVLAASIVEFLVGWREQRKIRVGADAVHLDILQSAAIAAPVVLVAALAPLAV